MSAYAETMPNYQKMGQKVAIFAFTLLINVLLFALIPFLAETEKKQQDYAEPAVAVTMEKPQIIEEPHPQEKKPEVKEKEPQRLPEEPSMADQQAPTPPMPELDLKMPDFDLAADGGVGMSVAAPPKVDGIDSVFSLRELDRKPRLVHQIEPVYPHEARSKGVEGKVILRFVVNKSGHVTNIRVVRASPEGVFDEKAKEAVSQWRFEPGMHRGEPVESRVTMPIRFEM